MTISRRKIGRVFCIAYTLFQSVWAPAFVVTGTAVNQASSPVANVNIDFINSSGINIPLVGDSTQANGTFSVNVPSGTYRITYTALIGSGLAGGEQLNISVTSDRSVPTMTLPPGYEITLQTVSSTGSLLNSINADFTNASAVAVFAPRNTSNSSGIIQTVIPQTGAPYTMKLKDVGGRGYADKEFINVAPGANVDYGQIIVGPARAVTGRTVRFSNNAIVTSVDIDMIDACGLEIRLTGDLSDAAGLFSLSGVSDGIYQIVVRPPGASGLARREFKDVRISAALNLGDIKLGTERTITGTVVNSGAVPIQGIDLDFTDEYYNQQIFVNNDNTLANGTFSVLASDGTYTIDFRPPSATPYAPKTIFGVVVIGNVNLGTIVLGNYVTLSGTVRDFNNVPVANADLDVIDLTAQKRVFTPNDKTDANGVYAARLSPGTWKLIYSPPVTRPDLQSQTFSSQSVPANTTLNVTLPPAATAAADWQLYE
ncbi:MAG: carboxypeptidase-like regulatory domain-containing protein [Candidatus Sumerlaeaceae bacterium]